MRGNRIKHKVSCCALPNPQMKADKTKKVWELYCFIPHSGLRITTGMDKTIAHTNGYVKSQ